MLDVQLWEVGVTDQDTEKKTEYDSSCYFPRSMVFINQGVREYPRTENADPEDVRAAETLIRKPLGGKVFVMKLCLWMCDTVMSAYAHARLAWAEPRQGRGGLGAPPCLVEGSGLRAASGQVEPCHRAP